MATPFDGQPCDCHELAGDGIIDLSMKFKVDELVAALELDSLSPGALVELVVTGMLDDGREFISRDCGRLVPSGFRTCNLGRQFKHSRGVVRRAPAE